MSSSSDSSGGIGFCGLLTLIFITLKLTHYIDWSWWWVLAPMWIGAAAIITIILGALILALYKTFRD